MERISNYIAPRTYAVKLWINSFISNLSFNKTICALLDQGIISTTNFLTGLIIGRICGKEQLGLYALGMTVVSLALSAQGSLIIMPYTIYSPRFKGIKIASYNGSTLLHQISLSLFCVILLLICSTVIFSIDSNIDLLSILKPLILSITFILLWDYVRKISFSLLKFKSAMILDFSLSFLQLSSLFILQHYSMLSAPNVIKIAGITCALTSLTWLYYMRNNIIFNLSKTWTYLVINLTVGKWIFASSVLWTLGTYLYPWLLTYFHGTGATGIWAACISVVNLTNPVVLGLQNIIRPTITHSYKNKDINQLNRAAIHSMFVFAFMFLPFLIIFLFFGGSILTTIFGIKFAGNHPTVIFIALNSLMTALSFSLSRAFFTLKRADIDFKINLLSLLNLLLFGIFLSKRFGTTGAAFALFLSNFILFFSLLIMFYKNCLKQKNF